MTQRTLDRAFAALFDRVGAPEEHSRSRREQALLEALQPSSSDAEELAFQSFLRRYLPLLVRTGAPGLLSLALREAEPSPVARAAEALRKTAHGPSFVLRANPRSSTPANNALLALFEANAGAIFVQARILPEEKHLLTVDDRSTLQLWSLEDGRLVQSASTKTSVCSHLLLSDDGSMAALLHVPGSTVTLWELPSLTLRWTKKTRKKYVQLAAFSFDQTALLLTAPERGQWLATTDGTETQEFDGPRKLLEFVTKGPSPYFVAFDGRERLRFFTNTLDPTHDKKVPQRLRCSNVCALPYGTGLLLADADGALSQLSWEGLDPKEPVVFRKGNRHVHEGSIALDTAPQGSALRITTAGSIERWSLSDGKMQLELRPECRLRPVASLARSGSKAVVLTEVGTLRWLSLAEGVALPRHPRVGSAVQSLHCDTHSQMLWVRHGTWSEWSLDALELRKHLPLPPHPTSIVSVSSKGPRWASGGSGFVEFHENAGDFLTKVAFEPLVWMDPLALYGDEALALVRSSQGKLVSIAYRTGKILGTFDFPGGSSAAWCVCKQRPALLVAEGTTVRRYTAPDFSKAEVLATLSFAPKELLLSPSEETVFACSEQQFAVVSLQTRAVLAVHSTDRSSLKSTAVFRSQLSPKGTRLLRWRSETEEAFVLDLSTGKSRAVAGSFDRAVFLQSEEFFAVSEGPELRVHGTESAAVLARVPFEAAISAFCVDERGRILVGDQLGYLHRFETSLSCE